MELKQTIINAITVIVLVCGGIGGCTYTVTQNNARWYDSMNQCISKGGSFIPTKGDSGSAGCLMR
jgi:hypothetical protein